jgi:hypothetical protein
MSQASGLKVNQLKIWIILLAKDIVIRTRNFNLDPGQGLFQSLLIYLKRNTKKKKMRIWFK